MYDRKEAAIKRESFWTAFGQYMLPVPSAGGEKVNWVNYKTGVRDIYFRMHAGQNNASIAIVLTHKDEGSREEMFFRMKDYDAMLKPIDGASWVWELDASDDQGRPVSRIYQEMQPVNIMDTTQWPRLISFFKPRIMALDAYWNEVRWMLD